MLDKLIRLLNGVTSEDYNLINSQYIQQRELSNTLRNSNDFLMKEILHEREERKQLQELLFKAYGVVTSSPESSQVNSDMKPITLTKERWSSLKGRMEQDDRKRVQSEIANANEA